MSHTVTCPRCGAPHDIEALEPHYRHPDAFLLVPPEERAQRTMGSKDARGVRSADDSERRYFLRVLMPFAVNGLAKPCSWGIWVEVSEEHFQRTNDLWDDPKQHLEPAFPGRVANAFNDYAGSSSIFGLVTLTDPSNVPHFHISGPPDHPLFTAQRTGVSPEQAMAWLVPIFHPEVLSGGAAG